MERITSIILHYNRQQNIEQIINAIRKQSIQSKIWIWDNSNNLPNYDVNCIIRSTKNFCCLPRFILSKMVDTEFIWTQDDDHKIIDNSLFEKLIELEKINPNTLIGINGKKFDESVNKEKPYQHYTCCVGNGITDVQNMGFSFFRTEIMNNIPNPYFNNVYKMTDEKIKYGDDIWASRFLETRSSEIIKKGIELISECGIGLSKVYQHMDIRNQLCKELFL